MRSEPIKVEGGGWLKNKGETSGDRWETSVKSREPKHSEHPECTWRQVGDKWTQVGDKCEIMQAKNPECNERLSGDKWETSEKSCGQKIQSVVGTKVGTSGRQVRK